MDIGPGSFASQRREANNVVTDIKASSGLSGRRMSADGMAARSM